MDFTQIIWIFFVVVTLWPMLKQQNLGRSRLRIHQLIEKKRGSRLITMIHRQEKVSILGMHISRYIDIEDSEQILRAIRLTPNDMPIDIVLHTPGGLVLAAEQIARALIRHEAKVTVIIPHYAMSGGTLLALAADEIIMDCNAVLGPVDPQLGQFPAASIIKAVEQKNVDRVDDTTLIMADMARKATKQMEDFMTSVLEDKKYENARELAKMLTEGRWTHDYPITCEILSEMGLKVNHDFPTEVYDLMDLYPQPAQRRPSVEYIPLPYGDRSQKPKSM